MTELDWVAAVRRRLASLLHLTRSRVLLFVREPSDIFFAFGFPLLMTLALGMAFRNTGPEPIPVALVRSMAVPATRLETAERALRSAPAVALTVLSPDEAVRALHTAKVVLLVEPTTDGYDYRFDPTRPESRGARTEVDDALQRADGRVDPTHTQSRLITEVGSRYVDLLVPGLIGFALMAGGLTGIAMMLVDLRAKGLIKRFVATPMSRVDFLLSFLLMRLSLLAVEVPLLLGFARLVFGVPMRGSIFAFVAVVVAGAIALASIGILLGSRSAKVAELQGVMILIVMPMTITSGVFFSSTRFPAVVQPVIRALPLTIVVDALRAVMLDGATLRTAGPRIVALLGWGVGCLLLSMKLFRWR